MGKVQRAPERKRAAPDNTAYQVLQPMEWVEVRSAEEIRSTLNAKDRLYGLNFMPEMWKYCGQRFRVFKQVSKIMLESTGELREMRRPTYYLEGVYCDGEFHQGCDRSCFLLWREEWLKRVQGPDNGGNAMGSDFTKGGTGSDDVPPPQGS